MQFNPCAMEENRPNASIVKLNWDTISKTGTLCQINRDTVPVLLMVSQFTSVALAHVWNHVVVNNICLNILFMIKRCSFHWFILWPVM